MNLVIIYQYENFCIVKHIAVLLNSDHIFSSIALWHREDLQGNFLNVYISHFS